VAGFRRSLSGGLVTAAGLAREAWQWTGVAVDSLLFPPFCPVCDAGTGGPPFCDDCRQELLAASGPTCPRCAMPVGPHADLNGGCSECRGRSLGFDRAIVLGPYQGPIRHLCLSLKHERNAWMARWLAELLVEARLEAIRAAIDGESPARVVPIPLHWFRRMFRGYDQADELAIAMARALKLKLRRPLKRVVSTPKLAQIGRVERAEIMRHAFRARPRRDLQGRTVLLVDDILTTGATCGAAARALKKAGASKVVVVAVARAEGKP
jgi:ComF family protein